MNYKELASQPIFFEKNRVFRVYTGGYLFADFFGDDSKDGHYPEEWVASTVNAMNKDDSDANTGLSKIRGTDIFLKNLMISEKNMLLGDRDNMGVLVKILDSAIRLPVQAHPDRDFSEKYFNSSYGKTESWVILATRKNAKIYVGFNRKLTKEEFIAASLRSESDKSAMEELITAITPKVGDVYLLPAKLVHAIGYGCLILEVQEPTDFTVQPEFWCGDYLLSDYEQYLGLDHDIAFDCFDYSFYGDKAMKMSKKEPEIFFDENNVKIEKLITYKDTPCFAINRYNLKSGELYQGLIGPAVYVVTDGEGILIFNEKKYNVKKGDYFLVPNSINRKSSIMTNTVLQVVECLPPL